MLSTLFLFRCGDSDVMVKAKQLVVKFVQNVITEMRMNSGSEQPTHSTSQYKDSSSIPSSTITLPLHNTKQQKRTLIAAPTNNSNVVLTVSQLDFVEVMGDGGPIRDDKVSHLLHIT